MDGHGDPGAGGTWKAENVGGLPSLKIRHGPWQTLGWSRTLVEANL